MRRVLLLLACLLPAALHATVIVPAEFREIVSGSDIIAYGRVVDTAVEQSGDRHRVTTLITLQVGTYLKGGPGETLIFQVPGGQVGRYRNVMVGAPRFAIGEETIVFLTSRGGGHPVVFGLNQGVFRVRVDGETRRRLVTPPALLSPPDGAAVVRGSPDRRPLPLETFGLQVQTVLAEAGAEGAR